VCVCVCVFACVHACDARMCACVHVHSVNKVYHTKQWDDKAYQTTKIEVQVSCSELCSVYLFKKKASASVLVSDTKWLQSSGIVAGECVQRPSGPWRSFEMQQKCTHEIDTLGLCNFGFCTSSA